MVKNHITPQLSNDPTSDAQPDREHTVQASNRKGVGLAVFVKTPGKTPLKTRLAATVGTERAIAFYQLSLNILTQELERWQSRKPDRYVYWAVAELDGLLDPQWSNFPTLPQGEGGLGDRLHTVSNHLIQRHKVGMLLGADCPLLQVEHLEEAEKRLVQNPANGTIFGPAKDGGFYLMASDKFISKTAWNAVPYSQEDTLKRLVDQLNGTSSFLEPLPDVDTFADVEEVVNLADQRLSRNAYTQLLAWFQAARQDI